jgi:hypothetical protein
MEISEAVVVEADRLVPLDYRYHCQDESNRLVFRYDCTRHFPGLPGFLTTSMCPAPCCRRPSPTSRR